MRFAYEWDVAWINLSGSVDFWQALPVTFNSYNWFCTMQRVSHPVGGTHSHRKWNSIFARAKQHTDDRDQTLVKLLLYDQFMMPRFMFEEVERYRFLNVVNVNVKILKIWSLILRLQTLNLRSGKAILGTYDRIQLPETGSISTISRSRSITVFDQLWNEHTNPIKLEAWRNFLLISILKKINKATMKTNVTKMKKKISCLMSSKSNLAQKIIIIRFEYSIPNRTEQNRTEPSK